MESATVSFVPREYDVFAGVDVDKTSYAVTLLDHGDLVKSFRMPAKPDQLTAYVREHFPEKRVAFAYEAGPTGFGLHDHIQSQGYPCVVATASMIPTAPGDRVKTNRLDSVKLAANLRGGQLKGIHVPSMVFRELRHLAHLRDTHVRQVVAYKARIKALLLLESLPFPKQASHNWTLSTIAGLKELPCGPTVRFKLDQFLESLKFHATAALKVTREIRRFCRTDPELSRSIELLTSLPGVGFIVASHFMARIGDWRLLRNRRQLAGFLGVVPREFSTGSTVRRGGITRYGDPHLRAKFVQAAWIAIRTDPELRAFYRRVCAKHPRFYGPQKAIVAVARKLVMRAYAVLKEQRPYEPRPVQN